MNIDKFVAEHGRFRGQEIPGFREHVVPVAQEILKASRHLSSTSLANNVGHDGIDFRGSSKGTSAAAIARRLCGIPKLYVGGVDELRSAKPADPEALAIVCRDLRLDSNRYNRQTGRYGLASPIEADREFLVNIIKSCRSDWDRREYERALEVLGPPPGGRVTLEIETGPQFNGVIEALKKFVKDGNNSVDDPGLAKLDAVQAVIDRLEASL
jgi:hypothetical protein